MGLREIARNPAASRFYAYGCAVARSSENTRNVADIRRLTRIHANLSTRASRSVWDGLEAVQTAQKTIRPNWRLAATKMRNLASRRYHLGATDDCPKSGLFQQSQRTSAVVDARFMRHKVLRLYAQWRYAPQRATPSFSARLLAARKTGAWKGRWLAGRASC